MYIIVPSITINNITDNKNTMIFGTAFLKAICIVYAPLIYLLSLNTLKILIILIDLITVKVCKLGNVKIKYVGKIANKSMIPIVEKIYFRGLLIEYILKKYSIVKSF